MNDSGCEFETLSELSFGALDSQLLNVRAIGRSCTKILGDLLV